MTALCKTYYVNPQIGSDTNDGLTPEKPLATLFAVNRLALAPCDTVLLKSSSCICAAAAKKIVPSPSLPMVKAAPRALTLTGRGFGIRTMAAHWIHPPMCTAGMFPPPCCCMMQPMSRCVIWS